MKKALVVAALLVSCSKSSDKTSSPISPLETANAAPSVISAVESVCAIDDFSKYPIDAPIVRTDLYQCGSIGAEPNGFRSFIEVFSDQSRKYNTRIYIPALGIDDRFIAEERAIAAAPYSPIIREAGKIQSSNVLNGITAQTKAALGYGEDSNYQINLRSSSMQSNIEMFLTVVGEGYTGVPLPIGYGICVRLGR